MIRGIEYNNVSNAENINSSEEIRRIMSDKISIIIPVYNAEPYLSQCIESILKQDYEEVSIVFVEGGSQDKSRKMCEDYAARYENVYLSPQSGKGASHARNVGLEHVREGYVMFVDADDYLPEKDILSRMAAEMRKSKADILVGDYFRLWGERLLPAGSCSGFNRFSRDERTFRFRGFFSIGTLSYVWGKLYSRAFLEQNGVWFSEFRYGEDKLFNFECYIRGARYAFFERPVYVYRRNEASISYTYRSDSVAGWMGIADKTEQLLYEKGLEGEYGDLVACTIFFAAFFDGKMNYEHNGKTIAAVKRVLKEYGKEELAAKYFSEMAKGRQLKSLSPFIWRVMIWGFACGMWLHWYTLLSFGIRLLVGLRIDERLSDTGLREES